MPERKVVGGLHTLCGPSAAREPYEETRTVDPHQRCWQRLRQGLASTSCPPALLWLEAGTRLVEALVSPAAVQGQSIGSVGPVSVLIGDICVTVVELFQYDIFRREVELWLFCGTLTLTPPSPAQTGSAQSNHGSEFLAKKAVSISVKLHSPCDSGAVKPQSRNFQNCFFSECTECPQSHKDKTADDADDEVKTAAVELMLERL
ncbi:hypothetical protein MG293_014265 [Ovis ammon polii]|uniref:Uncharacterized protein n=1 Tax=Ovis ammon polii TaxID=230172 RepID=A0AAD4TWQ3_OVIAM|nr:hypothetical protein MG293_014265 [Ovis ammon polii]KAI4561439.1 hypothetical protein MJT46_012129 [Ovis ammon polii x Ovis aries]